jgi:protein O-mannosyl-transferase
VLALAVWAVFGQTLHDGFLRYDDEDYVKNNPNVTAGLTLKGIAAAFVRVDPQCPDWAPLTTLSHMLDCQFCGLRPAGHHLTNVLLHAATAILLFLVLWNMTGALWRSAFVAAVFAIHPLRAESVAWVTERKDVLSGLFFMLTLAAYVRFARWAGQRGPGAWNCFRSPFYWLALLLFSLGLLAKTMLVTLPFVLLLLDYWPLNRLASAATAAAQTRPSNWLRLCLEKVPFFALSAGGCVATILAQRDVIKSVPHLTIFARVANALVSYATYLWQMVWPAGLAVFYPHPGSQLSVWKAGLCALILLIISAGVMLERGKHPYLLVGWLWYLGMLVPVIGLVQVGGQARADRYTYLPQIGLYLMVAWGAAAWSSGWIWRRVALGAGAVASITGFLIVDYIQTAYWKDDVTLWAHAEACVPENFTVEDNLGAALADRGNLADATVHYQRSLELKPDDFEAHLNLGSAWARQGRLAEAVPSWSRRCNSNRTTSRPIVIWLPPWPARENFLKPCRITSGRFN